MLKYAGLMNSLQLFSIGCYGRVGTRTWAALLQLTDFCQTGCSEIDL